ncbi:unnamed protein product, partial [marine sediment metagenome]
VDMGLINIASELTTPEAICWYDDSISAVIPENSNIWFSGFTFTDEISSENAIYINVYGQDWPDNNYPQRPGETHYDNDCDQTTFYIAAFGERLTTLVGDYSGSDSPGKFNTILVDAGGGLTNGIKQHTVALTKSHFVSDYADYGELQTSIGSRGDSGPYGSKVQLNRHVIFPDRKYFVLIDQMRSIDGLNHTYEWLLHGLDNVSNNGTTEATITKGSGVRLKAYYITPDLSLSSGSLAGGTGYIKVTAASTKDEDFLTILYPLDVGQAEPTVTNLNGAGYYAAKIENSDGKIVVMTQQGNTSRIVENITTDSEIVLAKEKTGVVLDYFQINNGKSFSFNSTQYINSSELINLTFKKEFTECTFQIESADSSISTTLTIGGLLHDTTYKITDYEITGRNAFKTLNKQFVFVTNSSGEYTYTQDVSKHEIVVEAETAGAIGTISGTVRDIETTDPITEALVEAKQG